jgi:RNA polymerase sigma-70 factor (ECF subfamily)
LPDPEESLGDARRREALWRGIRSLAPGARAVLTLALEGLSHEEIGDVLGITANNVGVRLSRARSELRAALGGSHEDR